MVLRHVDSFDHYTTVLEKYEGQDSNNSIGAGSARTGIAGLNLWNGGWIQRILDAQGTWVIGFAFKKDTDYQNQDICRTYDDASEQGVLRMTTLGALALDRGPTQVAISANAIITINTWHYIEFKHIIANAGGTLEVRVDGAVVATFTGDTQSTANATADSIYLLGAGDTRSHNFDDYYILDGTAGENDYLGDRRADALFPDGAGTYTEFATVFGAATHWEAVDEVDPDDDTTYVEESVVDDRDTYTFGAHPLSLATINGIQVLMYAKKTSAGAASFARIYRRGSDDQGSDVTLQTSYAYHREIMETDPIAAGAWTIPNINAAEFGARVR